MATTSYRGVAVPGPGDDILGGLQAAFDTAGVITQAASVAAARLALTEADMAGATISPAQPVYFNIGGVLYLADGARTSGVWTLRPMNEIEAVEQTYTASYLNNLAEGVFSAMIWSELPVRPYARSVACWATAYGSVVGNVDLGLRIGETDMVLSRFSSGDAQSQSVTNYGIIPAGQSPNITLGIRGGSQGGGRVVLSSDGRLNRLLVTAYPITMAG